MLRRMFLLLTALLGACSQDNQDSDRAGPSNNSGTLSGATLGTGTTSAADLRRVIAASGSGNGFEVTSAFVTRRSADDATVYLAVPVRNSTSSLRCAIHVDSVTWQDAAGQPLSSVPVPSMAGSVGRNGSTFSSACLGPKETGYAVDIETTTTLFSEAARVTLSLSSQDQGWSGPQARVVPTSYELVNGTAGPTLVVSFVNQGQAAATVRAGSRYFLLDATGPLGWDFLSQDIQPVGPLGPQAAGSASNALIGRFSGQASQLQAFIDFEDAS